MYNTHEVRAMDNKNKTMDEIDLTYEEWVSGGRYKWAREIYSNHGNGD